MTLDTNGDIFPEGRYTFTVSDIPVETDAKGYKGWHWSFTAQTEEGERTYNERFMVWLLAPLMRGLGFPEVASGKFDFEPTAALGRRVVATIRHVTLEKGASAGKTVARMTEIAPTPSGGRVAAAVPAHDDIPF